LIGVPVLTLVGAHAGWRSAFVLVGVLAALSATLVWRQARAQPWSSARPSSRPTLRHFRPVLSQPAITTILVSSLVGNAGLWTCITYLGVLYQNRLGLGAQEVGWAITAFGLGNLTGSLAAMDHRVGIATRRRLAACLLVSACCSASRSSRTQERPAWRLCSSVVGCSPVCNRSLCRCS